MLLSPLYLSRYCGVHAWQFWWLTQIVNTAILSPNSLSQLSIPSFHYVPDSFWQKLGCAHHSKKKKKKKASGLIFFRVLCFFSPLLQVAPSLLVVLLLSGILCINAAFLSVRLPHYLYIYIYILYIAYNVHMFTYYILTTSLKGACPESNVSSLLGTKQVSVGNDCTCSYTNSHFLERQEVLVYLLGG